MTVYESDVPGIGRRFELELTDGERVVVLVHYTGQRELYVERGPDDGVELPSLTDREASRLGAILEGAYFQPVERTGGAADGAGPPGSTTVQWRTVEAGGPLDGARLRETRYGSDDDLDVVAVRRGDETDACPDPAFRLAAGDTVVVVDDSEALEADATPPDAESAGSDGEDARERTDGDA